MIEVTKIAHLSGHKDSIYALTYNKNNKTMYSGAADGTVVRWNPLVEEDGNMIMKCPTPVYSLYVAPNEIIVAGTREGNLHIGDLKQNKELRWIKAHKKGIFDILPYLNGIVTLSEDGHLSVWNQQFEHVYQISISEKSLRVGKFIDEHRILIGSSDYNIYLVNLFTKKIERIFKGHTNSVFAITVDTINKIFYSGGRDAQLRKWSFEVENEEKLPAHIYPINALDIHPEMPYMLSCSMDKTIKLWDLKTFSLKKVIDYERHKSHLNCINKVLWIDTNHFISCSDDRTILVFGISNLI